MKTISRLALKTKEPHLVRILVEWSYCGTALDDCIEFARVCPASYVVHYGDGRVRKVLNRFGRRARYGTPKSRWYDSLGSHERGTFQRITFRIL